jgi:hypothetical protein
MVIPSLPFRTETTDSEPLVGGCQCRALRFSLMPPAVTTVYCHCIQCRRASGSAMTAWVLLEATRFSYSQGYPRCFLSTPEVQREFCPLCGTPLLIRTVHGGFVRVAQAALDVPTVLIPEAHIWTRHRLSWLRLSDGLPTYRDDFEPVCTSGDLRDRW